jgi:hypothetical protein
MFGNEFLKDRKIVKAHVFLLLNYLICANWPSELHFNLVFERENLWAFF